MISTIPSYTALGMAALLPNKEISYDDKTVLVDGKKCASTSERENILKSYYKDAVAITFNEVSNLTHKDLKDIFSNIYSSASGYLNETFLNSTVPHSFDLL